MTNRVFVLDTHRKPLMPCHPARARELLGAGRVSVFRHMPFTIILHDRTAEQSTLQPTQVKIDPGSKTTGLAVNVHGDKGWRCIWAANLSHRGGAVRAALDDRHGVRGSRRARKTPYREPRFDNRRRPAGWLPPSLASRIGNTLTMARRLRCLAPVTSISLERVAFDTQLLENSDISSVEYQHGTLFGYELTEYLLLKFDHSCAYCKGLSKDPILEKDHFQPRSHGGSNRAGNLVIACRSCNAEKDNQLPTEWLESMKKGRRKLDWQRSYSLEQLIAGWRPGFRHAAAVNATRHALADQLANLELPVEWGSGGRTKYNRKNQGYAKDHWIDAACVGRSGERVYISKTLRPLVITAKGRGSRQKCQVNEWGFPCTEPRGYKRIHEFQTDDLARLVPPKGIYKGTHTGRLTVRADGRFDIETRANGKSKKITAPHHRYRLLQHDDGYAYD